CSGHPRDLHSFPTRRSSDLVLETWKISPDLPLRQSKRFGCRSAHRLDRAGRCLIDDRNCADGLILGSLEHPFDAYAHRGIRILRSEEHTSELQSLAYIVCRL